MKAFSDISKYLIVFLVMIVLGVALLYFSSLTINKEMMKDKAVESAEFLVNHEFENNLFIINDRYDYLADFITLRLAYGLDNNVINTRYYRNKKGFQDMAKAMFIYEPNLTYNRYWHGSLIIVRPLLTFLNYQDIYQLNNIILIILEGLIVGLLVSKKEYGLGVAYLSILVLSNSFIVGNCLEYVSTFYLMNFGLIVVILKNKNKDKWFYMNFMIMGMVTAYFDFLTTEILTLLVPLSVLLYLRYKHDDKKVFKFSITCILFWALGYAGMWASKWILASIFLPDNVFQDIFSSIKYRTLGFTNVGATRIDTILRNVRMMIPFNYFKSVYLIGLILVGYGIFYYWFRYRKKNYLSICYLIIAWASIIRFLVLNNHSYIHAYFTFRELIITYLALYLAYKTGIDCNLLRRKHDEVNNLNTDAK